MKKYKYKTRSNSESIVSILDGERINLVGGSVEITLPSTKRKPAKKVVIRGATDADVEKLLNDPATYGDWSDKFIEVETGMTVKARQGTVKKSPVKSVVVKDIPKQAAPGKKEPEQEAEQEPEQEAEQEAEQEPEVEKAPEKKTTPKAKPKKTDDKSDK